MKKTFLDLVFLQNSILKGIICTLLALLTGCARNTNEDDNGYEIVRESFVPKGLPSDGSHLFAFVNDSVGYAATNYYGMGKYTISKTLDSGKNWEKLYQTSGVCNILRAYKDSVYYAHSINDDRRIYSQVRDEIGLIGTDRNTVLRSDIAGPVSHMTIFNDSTISYSIDFHKITKFQHIENISDSIYISNDFGNHWKKINDNIKILSVMGYDSSYVFYTGRVNEKNQWIISDFHSGDTDIYDYRNTFNAQADDGMLANYTNFYKYRDGQLKQISRFVWTKEKWFFSYGSCNTQFLAKNGELVIAFANQFPGKEGEEYCIFYSTDEGMTWSPIAIGRNLFLARFNQIPASKIPGEEGLTVIYQKGNSDSLHKITIRRRDL